MNTLLFKICLGYAAIIMAFTLIVKSQRSRLQTAEEDVLYYRFKWQGAEIEGYKNGFIDGRYTNEPPLFPIPGELVRLHEPYKDKNGHIIKK